MGHPGHARCVTLSQGKADHLSHLGRVFYERTEVAFHAEMVIFSKLTSLCERLGPPVCMELTWTAQEGAGFVAVYQQELHPKQGVAASLGGA
ncbi:MAG: hypothetical protein JO202_18430 [Ktedonobacteraceae bacterium]|nr:hypothetical protein [Ktedonobacteraceae bacterium]